GWFWNVATGKLARTFKGCSAVANSIAISSNGSFLAIGGEDHVIRVWDLKKSRELFPAPEAFSGCVYATLLSDGKTIFSHSRPQFAEYANGRFRLWDLKGKLLSQQDVDLEDAHEMAISRDGRIIAVAHGPHFSERLPPVSNSDLQSSIALYDRVTWKPLTKVENIR